MKNDKKARHETTVFEHLETTRVQKHVYDAIKASPDIDLHELSRDAKIPYATVRHSVKRLIELGYVGPKQFVILKELK